MFFTPISREQKNEKENKNKKENEKKLVPVYQQKKWDMFSNLEKSKQCRNCPN